MERMFKVMSLTCPNFDTHFQKWYEDVYRLCFLLVPSARSAYHCTFHVFLRLGTRTQPELPEEELRRFLVKEALEICGDFYRNKPHRRPAREQLAGKFPGPVGDDLWAVFSMPLKARAAFYLRDCMGLPAAESAALVGEQAVRISDPAGAAREYAALTLGEDRAGVLLDEIYLRFQERSVGLENRLLRIRSTLDRLVPWLALGVLLLCAAAALYTAGL